MPLTKKTITKTILAILVSITIIVVSFLYIIPLIFGTKFSVLETYSVCDDSGFSSLSLSFSCTGTVNINIVGPNSKTTDSDFFFKGDHDTLVHLGEYKDTVTPGQYKLNVFDNSNRELYTQTISLLGPNLTILSCEQKWWKREVIVGGYSLFGLKLSVQNNGDIPVYPYSLRVTMDSDTLTGLVLPCVINPNAIQYIECFIYRKSVPKNSDFSVKILDVDQNILATKSFTVEIADNVTTKQFNLEYNNNNYKCYLPKSDYLFNYYSNLDRINNEDYSLYIFDQYDDQYIDVIIETIFNRLGSMSSVDKVNYAASLAQKLEYKKDSETNGTYEYPNYPIETLFNNNIGRDCEDKAILTTCLLYQMNYNVSLLRFPEHMAVGVALSKAALPKYDFFIDNYYFLETTTEDQLCGNIPKAYSGSSNVTVYPIIARSLLSHNWKNNTITIYSNTERGNFVKVTAVIQNLGSDTAENFIFEAVFLTENNERSNNERVTISSLEPGMKKEVTISVTVPENIKTAFKTRLYLNDKIVDEKESVSTFP